MIFGGASTSLDHNDSRTRPRLTLWDRLYGAPLDRLARF